MKLKSKKPYLLSAMHSWITDNNMTPYILVDTTKPGVDVAEDFIQKGKIILNINNEAVDDIDIGEESLSFIAYFGEYNTAKKMLIPNNAILAIFAHETGDGLTFEKEDKKGLRGKLGDLAKGKILKKVTTTKITSDENTVSKEKKSKSKKPTLKVIK